MNSTAQPAPEAAKMRPIPEGFHTVTPYLLVKQSAQLAEFVKRAFGGVEVFSATGPQGGLHTHIKLGDSMVMIDGAPGMPHDETPAVIHLYVPDADAVYSQALQAGATSTGEPVDQPYGDREAGVKDLAGNVWYIATNKATGNAPEGFRSVTPYFHPRGAAQMIDFLKQAFGAEEVARHAGPDGAIQHAEVRIGDSMVEMAEAHGLYQPVPSSIYLYVGDVDATYQRALQAGAASVQPPEDKPYGDRNAGVKEAFGHTWWIAAHVKNVALS